MQLCNGQTVTTGRRSDVLPDGRQSNQLKSRQSSKALWLPQSLQELLFGPPSLLLSKYQWLFPQIKKVWGVADYLPLLSVVVNECPDLSYLYIYTSYATRSPGRTRGIRKPSHLLVQHRLNWYQTHSTAVGACKRLVAGTSLLRIHFYCYCNQVR